jgi:hypothetical protein
MHGRLFVTSVLRAQKRESSDNHYHTYTEVYVQPKLSPVCADTIGFELLTSRSVVEILLMCI